MAQCVVELERRIDAVRVVLEPHVAHALEREHARLGIGRRVTLERSPPGGAIVERPGIVPVDDSPVQAARGAGSRICSIGPSTHT